MAALYWLLLFFTISFVGGFLWGAGQEWWRMRHATASTPPLSAELAQTLSTPHAEPLSEAQAALLRPLVLHWLGLRTDTSDSRITAELPKTLRQRWYAMDLQHMNTGSTPEALLAFACLRCAFYLRAAAALGWLDSDLYNHITHLNVLRVRECFADWPAFCQAFEQGRSHWRTSGRSDIFGEHLNPERLRLWLWPEKIY